MTGCHFSEISTGRVDPLVGSGLVSSRFFVNYSWSGRVENFINLCLFAGKFIRFILIQTRPY